MRKFMLVAMLALFSTFLQAKDNNNNLFNCVQAGNLALNPECIANKIENNTQYIETLDNFTFEQQDLGGNVMATLRFYPEKMLIEVIAQDEYQKKAQVAAINLSSPQSNLIRQVN